MLIFIGFSQYNFLITNSKLSTYIVCNVDHFFFFMFHLDTKAVQHDLVS